MKSTMDGSLSRNLSAFRAFNGDDVTSRDYERVKHSVKLLKKCGEGSCNVAKIKDNE